MFAGLDRRHRRRVRGTATAVVAAAAVTLAACGDAQAPASRPERLQSPTAAPSTSRAGAAAPGPQIWTSYHADNARTGAVVSTASFDNAHVLWSKNLGGAVRGQALVFAGRVVAATENNRVVALDPRNGAVLWSASLGPPLTDVQAVAGCGDIDPLGSPARRSSTRHRHRLRRRRGQRRPRQRPPPPRGLSVATGAVRLSEDVDPPLPAGERPAHLLQRASLALGNGRVYVSYGGNDGDCGTYHGWVVGVNETGPAHQVRFRGRRRRPGRRDLGVRRRARRSTPPATSTSPPATRTPTRRRAVRTRRNTPRAS